MRPRLARAYLCRERGNSQVFLTGCWKNLQHQTRHQHWVGRGGGFLECDGTLYVKLTGKDLSPNPRPSSDVLQPLPARSPQVVICACKSCSCHYEVYGATRRGHKPTTICASCRRGEHATASNQTEPDDPHRRTPIYDIIEAAILGGPA